MLELDGASGGNQSFEVLKCGGLHLVITEVVPVSGGEVLELDGASGGNQSFEVLKCGGLHLVITEVVPVGGGEDEKVDIISVKLT